MSVFLIVLSAVIGFGLFASSIRSSRHRRRRTARRGDSIGQSEMTAAPSFGTDYPATQGSDGSCRPGGDSGALGGGDCNTAVDTGGFSGGDDGGSNW
jgi:hypothetical protein